MATESEVGLKYVIHRAGIASLKKMLGKNADFAEASGDTRLSEYLSGK